MRPTRLVWERTAKVFTKRKPSQVTVRLSDYPTDRLVDILNEQNKAREEEHEPRMRESRTRRFPSGVAAMALLAQDHILFPISVGENIAIGDPDAEDGPEKQVHVQAMTRLGGATEVIRELDRGLKEMTEVERYTEFSGGEIQRLVVSRTFMRISSGKVRLVVADEPTSAMDPEGEFELFEALREVQDGTTMIFITHRFVHLTKHAGLILCLKDGELVEPGSHRELVARDGEYSITPHKETGLPHSNFAENMDLRDILLATALSTLNITKELIPV
ncbi:hypothetical protein NLI96_g7794 [Meripilus lineatus]|uniref:ABC transporter domain-containing protein n=1 Tax=Meripilus lineatus TaxID=2056292 RepID=A0AAD5UYJ2_9APHY|nr:hypothetical protein NLI96_g7794 [Physisporinus lineatus]